MSCCCAATELSPTPQSKPIDCSTDSANQKGAVYSALYLVSNALCALLKLPEPLSSYCVAMICTMLVLQDSPLADWWLVVFSLLLR